MPCVYFPDGLEHQFLGLAPVVSPPCTVRFVEYLVHAVVAVFAVLRNLTPDALEEREGMVGREHFAVFPLVVVDDDGNLVFLAQVEERVETVPVGLSEREVGLRGDELAELHRDAYNVAAERLDEGESLVVDVSHPDVLRSTGCTDLKAAGEVESAVHGSFHRTVRRFFRPCDRVFPAGDKREQHERCSEY